MQWLEVLMQYSGVPLAEIVQNMLEACEGRHLINLFLQIHERAERSPRLCIAVNTACLRAPIAYYVLATMFNPKVTKNANRSDVQCWLKKPLIFYLAKMLVL